MITWLVFQVSLGMFLIASLVLTNSTSKIGFEDHEYLNCTIFENFSSNYFLIRYIYSTNKVHSTRFALTQGLYSKSLVYSNSS